MSLKHCQVFLQCSGARQVSATLSYLLEAQAVWSTDQQGDLGERFALSRFLLSSNMSVWQCARSSTLAPREIKCSTNNEEGLQ